MKFQPGDTVAYRASFLKAFGPAGDIAAMRGKVVSVKPFPAHGGPQRALVLVNWTGLDEDLCRVLDSNLATPGPNLRFADPSYCGV